MPLTKVAIFQSRISESVNFRENSPENFATGDSGRKFIRYSNVELKFWPHLPFSSNLEVY
jgi:hypothetical protein